MTTFEYDEAKERSFFQRYAVYFGIGFILLVVGGVIFARNAFSGSSARHVAKPVEVVIRPVNVPPPPPPPIQPTQKQEEKMEEVMEVDETATKPEDSAPAPADPNGTAMKGPGSDNFGLSSRVGKDFLGVNGTAKKSYGRWDWYAAKVQRNLREAMQGHRKTRSANFVVEMQIWPDSSGRIEKVKLLRSTGDATLDAALRTEVFPGLQLEEPPPAGMKLPINLRLSAKRTT